MAFILQKTQSDLQAIRTSETQRHKVWILTSAPMERWVHPGLCLAAQAWRCSVFDYLSGAVAHIQFDVEHMLCTQWANRRIKTSRTASQQMVQKDKPLCMLTNNNPCDLSTHYTVPQADERRISHTWVFWDVGGAIIWWFDAATVLTDFQVSKYYNSEQRSPDVSVCLWVIYPEDREFYPLAQQFV